MYEVRSATSGAVNTYSGYLGDFNDTLFLSSYFGIAYGEDRGDPVMDTGKTSGWRPFGPVGVEFKLVNWKGRAFSLNAAPLDIGVYIKNKLIDENTEAKVSDIYSPSMFFSISGKTYPVSLLAGYQWDRKTERTTEEDSYFVSIAFDLPVFTIW